MLYVTYVVAMYMHPICVMAFMTNWLWIKASLRPSLSVSTVLLYVNAVSLHSCRVFKFISPQSFSDALTVHVFV